MLLEVVLLIRLILRGVLLAFIRVSFRMKVLNDLLFSLRELWKLRKLEYELDWFSVMLHGDVVLQLVLVSIKSFAEWTSLVLD